jgi:hypothetical protein
MQIVFGGRVRTPPPGGYRTRLLRSGDEVTMGAHFGHSRAMSYLKCARAFRIETVVKATKAGSRARSERSEHVRITSTVHRLSGVGCPTVLA